MKKITDKEGIERAHWFHVYARRNVVTIVKSIVLKKEMYEDMAPRYIFMLVDIAKRYGVNSGF